MKQKYGTGLSKAERIARNTPQSRGKRMEYAPIPSDAQYVVIGRMKQGETLRLLCSGSVWIGNSRVNRRTFEIMKQAGWIVPHPEEPYSRANGQLWVLTPRGQGA